MVVGQIGAVAVMTLYAVYVANRDRGVPLVTVILGVFIAFWTFVASRTRFGRHIYAVGGSPEAARRAGIDVDRPDAPTADSQDDAAILIAISANDEIWIDRRETEPNAVRTMIERLHAENPKGSIVIQADEESTHETLVVVMEAAKQAGVTNVAIAALTESGSTPLWLSRISSDIPIYAMTRHVATRRKVTLYRGVYPVSFDVVSHDTLEANLEVIDELRRRGAVRDGDLVIITKGDLTGVEGGTNTLKILRVGG